MEKNKQHFFNKYSELSDKNYKLELLWSQKIIHGKLHKIRTNVTFIKWLLVVFLITTILIFLEIKFFR